MCLLSSQIYMIRLNTTSIVIGNPIIMCYTYCRNEFYTEPYIACVYAHFINEGVSQLNMSLSFVCAAFPVTRQFLWLISNINLP